MLALNKTQAALDTGAVLDMSQIDHDFCIIVDDETSSGKRQTVVKIFENEIQALAIFGEEDPLNGIVCFSVGYAVKESYRRRGLAVEVVNKDVARLTENLRGSEVKRFYLEAMVDRTNLPSIKFAEKFFSVSGRSSEDSQSGTPSLHFAKLISI